MILFHICLMEDEENVLLSVPGAGSDDFSKPFKRKSCKYESRCERFKVPSRDYSRQYCHVYFSRLTLMKRRVVDKAKKKWGLDCEKSLADLSGKNGQECVIVGTVFKQMDLKPSILKEISVKNHLAPQPSRVKYVGATDKLILEDNMQRVVLSWPHPQDTPTSQELVTGVVLAVLGREKKKGEFEVKDVCYPDIQPPGVWPKQEGGGATDDKHVLLVSGLNLGSSWCDQLSIEMMVDYITGQLGGVKDQEFCSSIAHVIIAGNSITDKPVKSSITIKDTQPKFVTRNYSAESLEAMKELDSVLAQLASCVSVDLMSGSHDPTNFQLPQKPMHRCMFPQAGRHSTLRGVSNPYHASFDGINFLGTSGQNVSDIYRFVTVHDRMNILENTLRWCHLAPTSPDTLACFPYSDEDPFIFEECPHVYFAGNQPRFQKKVIEIEERPVLLICVPNFDLTHSCVLVNLSTGDCREVKFATSLETTPNQALQRQREIEVEFEGEGAQILSQQEPEEEEMSILHHMDQEDNFDD